MTAQQLVDYYKSKVKAAAAIGCSEQTIKNWLASEKGIPHIKQLAIQTLTKGKLKAD